MIPDRAFFEKCWPAELPIPNEEQWRNAECRYHNENRAFNEALAEQGKVDLSDWQCSLDFVVATYTPAMWKTLFFPKGAA